MARPEWWPENAYDDQNPEMYYAFDEGAQAMAKALIERIEAMGAKAYCGRSRSKADEVLVLDGEDWTAFKAEVASEGE